LAIVQSASRPGTGPWRTQVNVSEADHNSCEPQLALNARGDAVAVWERGCDQEVVQAAGRSAAGSWQPPVIVSGAGYAVGRPQVAIDGRGHAVAVWESDRNRHFAVQAATTGRDR
jgi:hypothetical protein